MRFFEAGYAGAMATLGNAMTRSQYGLFLGTLERHPVYIAGDADEAGRKFADQVHKTIGDPSGETVVIFPPRGKDFGDLPTEEVRQWMQEHVGPPEKG
jgi:DNA primase